MEFSNQVTEVVVPFEAHVGVSELGHYVESELTVIIIIQNW